MISLVALQTATFIDRADLFLSLFSLFGLFGVAYRKKLFTVIFWRYFFYFGVIESFLYTIVMPLMGYERYEKPFVFNGLYVFEIVYTVILLYVLYLFAYRKPSIWMGKRS